MILGFYKTINKRPTYFKEKILSCKEPVPIRVEFEYTSPPQPTEKSFFGNKQLPLEMDAIGLVPTTKRYWLEMHLRPKHHTIREDKSNRWRAGMKIQMVYRGPKYSIADHFNKGISELEECKSCQTITIKWRRPSWLQKDYGDAIPPFTLKVKNQFLFVYIDDQLIGHKTLKQLALNDGFDSIADFLHYWKKSVVNWKIISWCDNSLY